MDRAGYWLKWYEQCRLCPRACGINRNGLPGKKGGRCGQSDRLTVAYVGAHFGEEPPISGTRGSGTVFLTGCPLKCTYCQNHQISHQGLGSPTPAPRLFSLLAALIHRGVHNVNFVTPDHFLPHVLWVTSMLRGHGFCLPIVYNVSGYQSVEMLQAAKPYVDIYLTDFKYSEGSLAKNLSACEDYPGVALDAITEMIKQKGFLDSCVHEKDRAEKGVLVRHLILPGQIQNSIESLSMLLVEFGPNLPLSLMCQYHPVLPQRAECLNRPVSREEFGRVYDHARSLGFRNLFVQFPKDPSLNPSMVPDFTNPEPFGTV